MGRWGLGVFLALVLGAALTAAAEGGRIAGRISLTLPDGQVAYGEWIRVFLVSEAVDAQAVVEAAGRLEYEPGVRLNRVHLDFFKAVSAKLNADKGYLVASTLTAEDGTFTFSDVALGRYWVLVTFPSMIGGGKVAWQVPVKVGAKTAAQVTLDNANLLFDIQAPRPALPGGPG